MKKLLIFLMAVSLLTACNNDKKNTRDRDDRSSTREKDDYRNSDDKTDNKDDMGKDDARTEDRDTDNQGWTRSDENKFMDDCERTAKENVGAARANEYCDCMLQRMKKMYSSYKEADDDLKGATQEEINKLAAPCNGQ
ncbi:MAG: hypothetical protein V9F01_00740 [Chitinophagaceae bacterium]